MFYHKIEVTLNKELSVEDSSDDTIYKYYGSVMSEKSEELFASDMNHNYIFGYMIKPERITLCGITEKNDETVRLVSDYLQLLELSFSSVKIEEISYQTMWSYLISAKRKDYVKDDEFLSVLGLPHLNRMVGFRLNEFMIDDNVSKDALVDKAKELCVVESLTDEIERINMGNKISGVKGHPVHYMITYEDREIEYTVSQTLVSALYVNGRVESRRCSIINIGKFDGIPDRSLDELYHSCKGAAVMIRYNGNEGNEEEYCASKDSEIIEEICEKIRKYKNSVLTLVCISANQKKIERYFTEFLEGVSVVKINEHTIFGKEAKKILESLAKEDGLTADGSLFETVEDENKGYYLSDLKKIHSGWLDGKLKTEVYPQYEQYSTAQCKTDYAKPKGSAIEQLNRMVGLKSAKDVIKKALNYYKIQKLYEDSGIPSVTPAMHMVFTGNPGTAKTTVARLFAQIMKDNGLLAKGDLYEVGRADLVGKYVGWTAQTVKKKFKMARGSVLFIDEAYSLLDDKEGLYGDEAINTIVQEMENNRDNMVVIFAGYPDKMDEFLSRNPGLRSRIAFHVPFEDYSPGELCDIAKFIAEENNLTLSDDATRKIYDICAECSTVPDFGNGRFARNLVESARMEQADRLMTRNAGVLTQSDLCTLTSDDFAVPNIGQKREMRRIGF